MNRCIDKLQALHIILKLIILFYLVLPVKGLCDDPGSFNNSEVVGTVKEDKPVWYAVIKSEDDQRGKLYMVGDLVYSKDNFLDTFSITEIGNNFMILKNGAGEALIITPGEKIPIENSDMVFVKTVEASVLEYNYSKVPKAPEDFALKELGDKKVSLEKRYRKGTFSGKLQTREERSLFESPKIEDAERQHLKADLFLNIKTDRTGENEWIIDGESAREAIENAEEVLFSIIRGVEPRFRFKEGPSLNFKSEVGDVVLNREGFVIENLAISKFGENFGIRQGDIIKTVNGQPVNSLFGIYKAYRTISTDKSIKTANVDIIRDGRSMRLTFRIR